MKDSMTSKRSCHVFQDEGIQRTENQQKHQATTMSTTYRSRRNSRSSGREDSVAVGSDPEEEKANSVSSRDSLAVMAPTPNMEASTAAVSSNVVHANGTISTPADAPPAFQYGYDSCHRTRLTNTFPADLPKLASSASSETDLPPATTDGRPHNFGVVIPGVYRSSYPKPEHFRFLKELKLRTIV